MQSVQPLVYHSVNPENLKTEYKANDVVDFRMSSNGRDILGNVIRILFDVEISYGTDVDPLSKKVYYDELSGGHVFINRVDTEFQNIGQIESIADYNRYISSKGQASMVKETTFNSNYACELRVPDKHTSNLMLKGTVHKQNEGATTLPAKAKSIDDSLKLDFCLPWINPPINMKKKENLNNLNHLVQLN